MKRATRTTIRGLAYLLTFFLSAVFLVFILLVSAHVALAQSTDICLYIETEYDASRQDELPYADRSTGLRHRDDKLIIREQGDQTTVTSLRMQETGRLHAHSFDDGDPWHPATGHNVFTGVIWVPPALPYAETAHFGGNMYGSRAYGAAVHGNAGSIETGSGVHREVEFWGYQIEQQYCHLAVKRPPADGGTWNGPNVPIYTIILEPDL